MSTGEIACSARPLCSAYTTVHYCPSSSGCRFLAVSPPHTPDRPFLQRYTFRQQ